MDDNVFHFTLILHRKDNKAKENKKKEQKRVSKRQTIHLLDFCTLQQMTFSFQGCCFYHVIVTQETIQKTLLCYLINFSRSGCQA